MTGVVGVIREAKHCGDAVHIDLWYPRNEDQPVKAIVVGLVDVRAADDIRIEFDFDRNGYRILMRRQPEPGTCSEDEPEPEEAAFVPARLEPGQPANRDRVERDELLAALKALAAESMTTEMLFADERPKGWKPPELERARALIARLEGAKKP